MTGENFHLKRALSPDALRWVRWLDAECFPEDSPAPLATKDSEWFLLELDGVPVAFCGWYPQEVGEDGARVGFLAKAGVLHSARGRGFQKLMINARCEAIRKAGLAVATTYTSPSNAASMNSLIACGFKATTGEYKGFVHWRKLLLRKRGKKFVPAP
jgi:GNAT superfamily N-acetyltransferase